MIVFQHGDRRFPFLWESAAQPAGRWHDELEGPVHYLADTPDGAWAEFLRHEAITDPDDLSGVARAMWAVELARVPPARPALPTGVLTGGLDSYAACRSEARRVRTSRAQGLVAPSAALEPRAAGGWRVDGGLRPGPDRDARVIVLFGRRPDLVGWLAAEGRPDARLLARVRHL